MKPITKRIATFAMACSILGAGAAFIPQTPLTITASAAYNDWDPDQYSAPKARTNYGVYGWCVSYGEEVKFIQCLCNSWGCTDDYGRRLVVDGCYGANTAAAVRKMQRIVGCYADGVFGPETRRRTMSPAQCNYDY